MSGLNDIENPNFIRVPLTEANALSAGETNSIVDLLRLIQERQNRYKIEYEGVLSIPLGSRLLDWTRRVKRTWWYRFFSMFDKSVNQS